MGTIYNLKLDERMRKIYYIITQVMINPRLDLDSQEYITMPIKVVYKSYAHMTWVR